MPYEFRTELDAIISNGQLSEGLFKKAAKLAKIEIRSYPTTILDSTLTYWTPDACQELADDFVVYFLCAEPKGVGGRTRLEYLIRIVKTTNSSPTSDVVDFLMVSFFRQYLSERMAQRYPYSANMIRRIRDVLSNFVKKRYIEMMEGGRRKRLRIYRRYGVNTEREITGEDLQSRTESLPKWKAVPINPESERISPLISQKDLEKIVAAVFDQHHGWIKESVLCSFLFVLLKVPDLQFVPVVVQGPEGDEASLEELTEGLDINTNPLLGIKLNDADKQMTPRQQEIYRLHYDKGFTVAEIAVRLGISLSLAFLERDTVRRILKEELR